MAATATIVLDSVRALLNDNGLVPDLYTDTVLLPYLKLANKDLEQKCVIFGIEVVRVVSAVLLIPSGALTIIPLPEDFLLPLRMWERGENGGDAEWAPMVEKMWKPANVIPTTTLGCWAFYNENINLVGSSVNREVKLEYERSLSVISASGSVIDTDKFYRFLAAVTAEKAARYIGNNALKAEEIKNEESLPAAWDLSQMLTLNQQGLRQRRGQYTTKRHSTLG